MHVAQLARRVLRLDQVWLLVSPGNPLKPATGMASASTRLKSAQSIADGRRIVATDIETRLGTRYTADTLQKLRKKFPCAKLIWLMGADNLVQLPRWRHWQRIVATMPFAVLPRPTYNHRALAGLAARRLRPVRLSARHAAILAELPAPHWIFLPTRQHAASATQIRLAAQIS